jgi:HEAT repeat protein
MLIAIAVLGVILGLGVHLYRSLSPVRRWTWESRPGNPSRVRMQAVLNLRYHVPQAEREEAFPVILAAAKDSDPVVRASAARALGGQPDHFEQVLPILRTLMTDPHPHVRECAMLELESFVKPGSPEAPALVSEFVAALDDPKPVVRLEAARALQVFGRMKAESKRLVPAMVRLIREETGVYRLGAIGYLTMIDTIPPELEPALRALSKSEIPDERIAARKALIVLGIPDQERDAMIKAMLGSQHLNERLTAAYILIQLGKREMAINALKSLVESNDITIRARAQKLLHMYETGEQSP